MASADCPRKTCRRPRAHLAALLLAGAAGCGDVASNAPTPADAAPQPHLGLLTAITPMNWRTPLFAPPSPALPQLEVAASPVSAASDPQLLPLPPVREASADATAQAVAVDMTPAHRELPQELPPANELDEADVADMLLPLSAFAAQDSLPPVDGLATVDNVNDAPTADAADASEASQNASVDAPAATPEALATPPTPEPIATSEPAHSAAAAEALAATIATSATPSAPAADLTPAPATAPPDEPKSHAAVPTETSPSTTGLPTGAMVNERAQAKIRRGYALAQRGANFAARSEFVDALRMIAEAKDQIHGAPRRTIALADGLRALDEADDFLPRAAEADADLGVAVIVAAHRTPVGKTAETAGLMPQKLAALYFRYAQVQLGAAVAGEPAGSMALHGLGKLYSQLGRVEPTKHPQAERRAFALQQAALVARGDNHLAAHELGVLLAEAGHLPEAEQVFSQVVAREPHPVVLRNLARVQRKLGREQMAAASERQAVLLAERSAGVEPVMWVTPETLARTGDSLAPAMPTMQPPSPPRPQPAPPQSPMIQNARRLPPGYQR